MNQPLKDKIAQRGQSFEGTVEVTGLRSTKLVSREGQASFETVAALKSTARAVAGRLGTTVQYVEPQRAAAAKRALRPARKTETN